MRFVDVRDEGWLFFISWNSKTQWAKRALLVNQPQTGSFQLSILSVLRVRLVHLSMMTPTCLSVFFIYQAWSLLDLDGFEIKLFSAWIETPNTTSIESLWFSNMKVGLSSVLYTTKRRREWWVDRWLFSSIFLKQLLLQVYGLPHEASIGRTGSWRVHLMKPASFLCWDSLKYDGCHKSTCYNPNYRHAMLQLTINHVNQRLSFFRIRILETLSSLPLSLNNNND